MTAYDASPIRDRWTAAKDAEVRAAIVAVLEEDHPQTVRGVFYRVLSMGLFAKAENNYVKVQRRVLEMRRDGTIDYSRITDGTRMRRKPASWDDVDDVLFNTARTYRRALWNDQAVNVEIWAEKDAIAGVLYDVTAVWDVPLLVSRGFSSETYIWAAGQEIARSGKPTKIYYFSDHDLAGHQLVDTVRRRLPDFCDPDLFTIERVAVTEEQIDDLGLITRDPKKRDLEAGFTRCCEVDAIPSRVLRQIAESCINSNVNAAALAQTEAVEAEERRVLAQLAGTAR